MAHENFYTKKYKGKRRQDKANYHKSGLIINQKRKDGTIVLKDKK